MDWCPKKTKATFKGFPSLRVVRTPPTIPSNAHLMPTLHTFSRRTVSYPPLCRLPHRLGTFRRLLEEWGFYMRNVKESRIVGHATSAEGWQVLRQLCPMNECPKKCVLLSEWRTRRAELCGMACICLCPAVNGKGCLIDLQFLV